MPRRTVFTYLILITVLLLFVGGYYAIAFQTQATELTSTATPASTPTAEPAPVSFDSSRAYADVQTQVDFGPRIPGSDGHAKVETWMRAELESADWTVEVQNTSRLGHPIHNIIAKRNEKAPEIILAAHYDTRMIADQDTDPAKQTMPVPGANDGASGVAILLELARTLPKDTQPVWLVFIDTEDNGRIDGWDWILGSRAFVEEVPMHPHAVVVLDMIGDSDLNIYYEKNSDITLRTEIWKTAAAQGHADVFIPTEKWSMIDDHTPFLEAGIPAVDLIDFDYPYWHTTQDTADKVSPESLYAVGDTLWHWIVQP